MIFGDLFTARKCFMKLAQAATGHEESTRIMGVIRGTCPAFEMFLWTEFSRHYLGSLCDAYIEWLQGEMVEDTAPINECNRDRCPAV
jgi:hypothetical protein